MIAHSHGHVAERSQTGAEIAPPADVRWAHLQQRVHDVAGFDRLGERVLIVAEGQERAGCCGQRYALAVQQIGIRVAGTDEIGRLARAFDAMALHVADTQTRLRGDLAERARAKKLKPEEVAGSTFTLTNSGIFGEEFGTPIINQPDSAILAIGGLKKEAAVLTDADGNDTIAIRWMQNFCLGFDHRTIDGADAGKFMAEFKKTLEGWSGDIG